MLIIPLFCLYILRSSLATRALHFGLGRVVQWPDRGEPSAIERLRLSISKTLAEGSDSLVKVHILRLRWSVPHEWNDNGNEDGRTFDIVCEGEESNTSQSFALLDVSISADITAIYERFAFPETALSIICAVRAVNSDEKKSKWKYSKLILLGTELGMMETKKEGEMEETIEGSKEGTVADVSELKSSLAMSKLEEVPYPKWKKRPAVDLNGNEIIEESIETSTTLPMKTISSSNSPEEVISAIETMEEVTSTTHTNNQTSAIIEKTTTKEITTARPEETTISLEEMMLLLHEAKKELISEVENEPTLDDNEEREENLPKADQIIREPDLFLRGLALKPSDLPEEESREDLHQELPFHSELFEEVLRQTPGKLTAKEKEDYDLLEARIRDAVGSPNLERVL